MKTTSVVQVIFYSIVLVFWGNSCISPPNTITDNMDRQKDEVVFLEVTTDASKTVYPPGKILILKLYSNREVEFDSYPRPTPDRVGLPFEAKRKKEKLSEEDFNKIVSLLDKPDLLNAKNNYSPTQRIMDSTIRVTVSIQSGNQEKITVLNENDSHLHFEDNSNLYPPSLIKLLKLVMNLNSKLVAQTNKQ